MISKPFTTEIAEERQRINQQDYEGTLQRTLESEVCYPSFCFTLTTVIFVNPSSNVGGLSFAAILRITSSGTIRSRRWWRSMQTSSGTSKNTPCTSYP